MLWLCNGLHYAGLKCSAVGIFEAGKSILLGISGFLQWVLIVMRSGGQWEDLNPSFQEASILESESPAGACRQSFCLLRSPTRMQLPFPLLICITGPSPSTMPDADLAKIHRLIAASPWPFSYTSYS
eukprot:c19026_g1_i1 orf=477-857(+)